MKGNSPGKLWKALLTPRKIAWVVVIAGIAYFIYVSPKTRVEFFDAEARDEAALGRCEIEKYKTIDPVGAAVFQKAEDLYSCCRQMRRIALLYDLAHNVKSTDAMLRANDKSYRALAQQAERYRKEMANDKHKREADDVQARVLKDHAFLAAVVRTEQEWSLLREFQAMLFLRDIR
jgi:hypothetical protein